MDDSKVFMFPNAASNSIDPGLLALLNNNGGFGNNGNWIWILFLWMMWGYGGWNNGGFGGNNGTGFLANQLNNDTGRDLLLQAINGRADALGQLAQITNGSVDQVRNAIGQLQLGISQVGSQVGMSGLEVQNAIALGNASLAQQLCNCCCENRASIADLKYTVATEACADRAAINDGIRDLLTAALQYHHPVLSKDPLDACPQLRLALRCILRTSCVPGIILIAGIAVVSALLYGYLRNDLDRLRRVLYSMFYCFFRF